MQFVDPENKQIAIIEMSENFQDTVDNYVATTGGVLIRNIDNPSAKIFDQILQKITATRAPYVFRSTPRSELGENIYTTTEYPANKKIVLHNEFSYLDTWPSRLIFFCLTPPETGGQTILANSHRMYQKLKTQLPNHFFTSNIGYKRLYTQMIDLPWQEVFQTSDKLKVENFCKNHQIHYQWHDGFTCLETYHERPMVMQHPTTHEMLWFNQAHLFHESNIDISDREYIYSILGNNTLTRSCTLANSTMIADEHCHIINKVYDEQTFSFNWQQGDLLIIDNMKIAHGRSPFTGYRKILVSMA